MFYQLSIWQWVQMLSKWNLLTACKRKGRFSHLEFSPPSTKEGPEHAHSSLRIPTKTWPKKYTRLSINHTFSPRRRGLALIDADGCSASTALCIAMLDKGCIPMGRCIATPPWLLRFNHNNNKNTICKALSPISDSHTFHLILSQETLDYTHFKIQRWQLQLG